MEVAGDVEVFLSQGVDCKTGYYSVIDLGVELQPFLVAKNKLKNTDTRNTHGHLTLHYTSI